MRDRFRRVDESRDDLFYRDPRFVEHIDPGAVAAVTAVYRRYVPAGADVLDLMSSWVSHLPPEIAYASVTGLGMNAAELDRNPRLDRRVVQNLNADPVLPFPGNSFDAALICVSVQYLTRPVEVFAELARVVRPGGCAIVTFSNRCFPTKAVAVWQTTGDGGHVTLVRGYFAAALGWTDAEVLAHTGRGDPLYAIVAKREPPHAV